MPAYTNIDACSIPLIYSHHDYHDVLFHVCYHVEYHTTFYYTAVPPPLVEVSRETEGQVDLLSVQILRCNVEIIEEVDIPVTVTTEWNTPALLHNESQTTTSNTSGQYPLYYSTLTISGYKYSDSGIYTCIAEVSPRENISGIQYKSVHNEGLLHISTGKLL